MTTPYFEQLYREVVRREHALGHTVTSLYSDRICGDVLSTIRLAKSLIQAGDDFEQDLMATARRNRMRILDTSGFCPHCGDPACQGSSLIPPSFAQMLKALLTHTPPPLPPPV